MTRLLIAGLLLLAARGVDEDLFTLKVTEGLAWKFRRTATQTAEDNVATDVHAFESTKPVQGRTFLRFSVRIDRHPDAAAAGAAFEALLGKADHNIGLTYEWDWVGLEGARVIHVNAPCLFSRENANRIFENVRKELTLQREMDCVCGGGCGESKIDRK